MVLSLLFGKKYPRDQVGSVVLDVTISEEHRYASRVTNFPVEDGTIISDHIINAPDTVLITGIVTDTPLAIFAPFNRSIDAFNRLVLIHAQRQVVDVVTGLKVYKNMAITTLDVPRTVNTGQSLTFRIELQRIIFDTSVQLSLTQGTVFGTRQSPISRDQVAPNTNYPIIQKDPPLSLKDQASSGVDTGIQNLQPVPPAILSRVLQSGIPLAA